MFINSKNAIMGIPIYLLIVIISAATIISILYFSINFVTNESQIYKVEYELNKIITEAENMFEYADEGTFITIHVNFPDTMKFAVFGDIPGKNLTELNEELLDENTSNNYYFIMNDGTLKSYHSNARFCGNYTTNIALFHSGVYNVNLELSHIGGKTFVKIY